MADIPHLAWPFRVAGGRLVQVEQDSIEDVQQNVRAFLHTERGTRSLSPDFGIDDPTFAPSIDAEGLARQIEDAEDGRAVVTVRVDRDHQGRVDVEVAVELAE